MFDFLKDMSLEARGINSEAVRELEEEKKRKEKEERVLLPKSFKRLAYVVGGIYLAISWTVLAVTHGQIGGVGAVAVSLSLSTIDIAAIVCLILKTKRSEIMALIFIAAFVAVLYASCLV